MNVRAQREPGISDKLWNVLGTLNLPISDERAYMFANGPIRDYGGWVDGPPSTTSWSS